MDDLVCPRCKTTKYRNPYLKLMVNVCGHALCDSCVDLLFVKGSAQCPDPDCGRPLRRAGFRNQLFEDASVEKEVDIRKRLLREFCKTQTDFLSLRDYNDYLEEVETIVFNLVNNIDELETNKKIDQYKKDNKDQITKAKSRLHPELLELEAILEEEKLRYEQRRFEATALEREEKIRKIKTKESLIDELMFSDTTAADIIATHKLKAEKDILEGIKAAEAAARKAASEVLKKGQLDPVTGMTTFSRFTGRTQFSSGITAGHLGIGTMLPIPKKEEFPLYRYVELNLEIGGPAVPTLEELRYNPSGYNYLANIKVETVSEKAGGFHRSLACRRALQDAYSDITFQPKEVGVKYEDVKLSFPDVMDMETN